PFESWDSTWSSCHTYVELLRKQSVVSRDYLSGERVPGNPPPAVRRNTRQAVHLHLEHQVIRSRRFAHRDVVNKQRSGRVRSEICFGMRGLVPMNDQSAARVTHVRRGNFICAA